MADRRGAATVRLCDEALTVLAESDRPLSTAEIAQAVGVPPIGTEAYRALLWLERHGHVDAEPLPHTGTRALYWTIPQQREENDRG